MDDRYHPSLSTLHFKSYTTYCHFRLAATVREIKREKDRERRRRIDYRFIPNP